jgi:transposase
MEGSAMPHFVGLDVALKTTHVVIVDERGGVTREAVVETEPKAIIGFLRGDRLRFRRVALEAGPLSQWLYRALVANGLPAVCIEAHHASAALRSNPNKTDRSDALGIAELARIGHFRGVHVKTEESQRTRAMLMARKVAQNKAQDIETSIRGILRPFGLRIGKVGAKAYEARVLELIGKDQHLEGAILPLLQARAALRAAAETYEERLQQIAEADPVCRRLMTVPGVGWMVALTYRAGVDVPERFKSSRDVGAHFGLTSVVRQSGVTEVRARISRCGDDNVRAALYSAAFVLLYSTKRQSDLRDWALAVKARRGGRKALVALARKLAVVLHSMWRAETEFRWVGQPG